MGAPKNNANLTVSAIPVKSFFVRMLTRDIGLEDAILDLLDNCVDGILRTGAAEADAVPYAGYQAEIEFDEDTFSIADNCGGIPWSLHDYAFRMGRADDAPSEVPGSVGVYGIGMKRAMFKLGEDCRILTQHSGEAYEVSISPAWISDEKEWTIPVRRLNGGLDVNGTTIKVTRLHPGIRARLGKDRESFSSDLYRMIATQYAFIIAKGFVVRINGERVEPRPTKLMFAPASKSEPAIRPFIFKTECDGVSVFMAVGFTGAIPSEAESLGAQEETRRSSLEAGWTIVCNDRAVVYCDRSELTGWGEAGVPRYHNQFIAISGIVEFRANDASMLPTTTTKRGIDASSPLYLQVKNKMREGMAIFIDYTNKWKGKAEESRVHDAPTMQFAELKAASDQLHFSTTRRAPGAGQQFKPALPQPQKIDPRRRRISFVRELDDIRTVADYLFDDPDIDPSVVGEKCFDLFAQEASE